MKTLCEQVEALLSDRSVAPLSGLLAAYDDEKDLAKCYSTFAYLSCAGAGGCRELSTAMGEMIEAFYLATSVHDDALDSEDEALQQCRFSTSTYIVLGDCFFVRLTLAMAQATPLVPEANRAIVLETFQRYMMDVAESQVVDEHSRGQAVSRDGAVKQMRLRGGTWGRLCVEIPALAGGLSEEEATRLGDAGQNLFMALTVRDDLMDLRDDLQNGVLTLAPAIFLEQVDSPDIGPTLELTQIDALIDLLHSEGAVQAALDCGSNYAATARRQVNEFLAARDDMNWYLLLMLFRMLEKRFDEFTPEDVSQQRLDSGLGGVRKLGARD